MGTDRRKRFGARCRQRLMENAPRAAGQAAWAAAGGSAQMTIIAGGEWGGMSVYEAAQTELSGARHWKGTWGAGLAKVVGKRRMGPWKPGGGRLLEQGGAGQGAQAR